MSDKQQEAPGMDVGYVARLARIDLTAEETELFQSQLGQVLEYVDQLNELEVGDVEPMAHAIPVFNVLREDVQGESLSREAILANAPAVRDHQFVVPKILD